jgi:hypothetical protein
MAPAHSVYHTHCYGCLMCSLSSRLIIIQFPLQPRKPLTHISLARGGDTRHRYHAPVGFSEEPRLHLIHRYRIASDSFFLVSLVPFLISKGSVLHRIKVIKPTLFLLLPQYFSLQFIFQISESL